MVLPVGVVVSSLLVVRKGGCSFQVLVV